MKEKEIKQLVEWSYQEGFKSAIGIIQSFLNKMNTDSEKLIHDNFEKFNSQSKQ